MINDDGQGGKKQRCWTSLITDKKKFFLKRGKIKKVEKKKKKHRLPFDMFQSVKYREDVIYTSVLSGDFLN